jgi:hypothetical protein
MRPAEKISLIDKIGRELQSRFTYSDIDTFLSEFHVDPPKSVTSNSKWIYSKAALQGIPIETIFRIADELGLDPVQVSHGATTPPRNWEGTNKFRLFISHISQDKEKATRLKACLAAYGIDAFVAHEDIRATLEWEHEIERALYVMDAFLAIHTRGFKESFWTQQEIGFAVGRGVKIISLKMGEDPTGFISKRQALPRGRRTAEEVAAEIDTLLMADPATSSKLEAAKRNNGLIKDKNGVSLDDAIPC